MEKNIQYMSYLEKPKGELDDGYIVLNITFIAWVASTAVSLKDL